MKTLKLSIILAVFVLLSGRVFSQQSLDAAKKLTINEQYQQAEIMYKQLIEATPQAGDIYYFYGENELLTFFSDTVTLTQEESFAKCRKIGRLSFISL